MNSFYGVGLLQWITVPKGHERAVNGLGFLLAVRKRKNSLDTENLQFDPVTCIAIDNKIIDLLCKRSQNDLIAVRGKVSSGILTDANDGIESPTSFVQVDSFSYFKQNEQGVIEELFPEE